MDDVLSKIKEQWLNEDIKYKQYLQGQLLEFGKLYLNHFEKPLYREINTMVIENLKRELEDVNARLCSNQAGERSIRYYMAENTATAG